MPLQTSQVFIQLIPIIHHDSISTILNNNDSNQNMTRKTVK